MAEQQPVQISPERQAEVTKVEQIFRSFDKEGKGAVEVGHFGEVLKQDGFTFDAKLSRNLSTVLDFFSQGAIDFLSYLWLHDLLTAARNQFNTASKGAATAPVSTLGDVLKGLAYNFHEKTLHLVSGMVDREKKGAYSFDQLVTLLAFVRFCFNHFTEADADQGGSLDIEEVKSKLVWLGISGATDDQVKATFEKYDLDKSNSLEFEEFVGMAISLKFPELAH
jgi:Ca2+-binding EF-hand superfamily protein